MTRRGATWDDAVYTWDDAIAVWDDAGEPDLTTRRIARSDSWRSIRALRGRASVPLAGRHAAADEGRETGPLPGRTARAI